MPELLQFLDPLDERWVSFVASQPQANIFHHPAWSNLLAECYSYRPFIAAWHDAGGAIRAGLPMMEIKSLLTGTRWVSLPFTDHCRPLCGDRPELLSCLTDRLVHLAQDTGTPRIEVRWRLPLHPAIQSSCEHVWHSVELSPDIESVSRRFHSAHQRNLKVAARRGARIEWMETPEQLKAYYRLHVLTRRRQGTPTQPWRFFDSLGSGLLEQGLGFGLLAYKDHECLAGAVFLRWQQTLTYKYGASCRESLGLRPNHLLFWTAIRWGCEHGCTVFDLGRTDVANTGLRAFKNRWGATEVPLTYSTLPAASRWRVPGRLMPGLQTMVRHSPLWVCRAAGALLYRHFG